MLVKRQILQFFIFFLAPEKVETCPERYARKLREGWE
jgi:hypothetical protein